MTSRCRSIVSAAITGLVLSLTAEFCRADPSQDISVMASAVTQDSPPQIRIYWQSFTNATSIKIYRKTRASGSWGAALTTLNGNATNWTDTSVSIGAAYEYRIDKNSASQPAYGYLLSGVKASLIETRGKIVLVVDNTHTNTLAAEIAALETDLTGDGWSVIRHNVSPTASISSVKTLIVNSYQSDPANVKAVYLLGHIPVPYSGLINPDEHDDHEGAWPADVYYGDMNGTWTDTSVNSTINDLRIQNVPGDGKFDQDTIPSDLELMVGRVDTGNMPAFSAGETELLRRYLNKSRDYRHRVTALPERGLIKDFFQYPEGFSQTGWRNFTAFFTRANVRDALWSTLETEGYLCAYGAGPGSYTSAGGIATTQDYASRDFMASFQLLFGSYFGDWDNQNNFLRAPICAETYGLASAWSGRPSWQMHTMGLGEPVGASALMTQNNNGTLYYSADWNRYVHIALMGDPTLRLKYVAPTPSLKTLCTVVTSTVASVDLDWAPSPDSVEGYHVYRSAGRLGPFTRLTTTPAATNTWSDPYPPAGRLYYMVRAIALQTTASGSYYDGSQGIFSDVFVENPVTGPSVPAGLSTSSVGVAQIGLRWDPSTDPESGIFGYNVYCDSAFRAAVTGPEYTDSGLNEDTEYSYEVAAVNGGHIESARSAPLAVKTLIDAVAPCIDSVTAKTSLTNVTVVFTETVEEVGAETVSNYSLDNGVTVLGASLGSDNMTVLLATSTLWPTTRYTLTVNNIADRAAAPNTIAPDSQATFIPAMTFTAYNDFALAPGHLSYRITAYSRNQGGKLTDYATGDETQAALAVGDGGGGPYFDQGADPAAGTDAHNVFNGMLNAGGLISYGSDLVLTFSGLCPALKYEAVLFGNRNAATYTNRLTTSTISGVDSFINASTSGFSAPDDPSTVTTNGWNTQSGHVARFGDIRPGSDGSFIITISGSRFYINALRFRTEPGPADNDHDGMPDIWEETYLGGTNQPLGGAWEDMDGDGAVNRDEFIAGTDPGGEESLTEISTLFDAGNVMIALPTEAIEGPGYDAAGRYYRLEFRPDMIGGAWIPVAGFERLLGTNQVILHTPDPTNLTGFYRGKTWME